MTFGHAMPNSGGDSYDVTEHLDASEIIADGDVRDDGSDDTSDDDTDGDADDGHPA